MISVSTWQAWLLAQVIGVYDWGADRVARMRGQDRDRGDIPGWVIVTAVVVTLAIAIGVIITNKVTTKANNIDLGD